MKKSIYTGTALALAVILSACGSTADASDEKPAETAASAEASAAPLTDLLDRLPEQPFGLDAGKIVADPAHFEIQWQMDENTADVPVADALTAFLQVQWLANERQTYIAGPDKDKILGSLEDAEHFVAAEYVDSMRKRADEGVAYAEAFEEEDGELASPNEPVPYPLHLGLVASPDSEEPAELIEQRKKNWPEISEGDGHGWLQIDGEEFETPFLGSSETRLTPRIHYVYVPEADPHVVEILAYLDYELALADGRTALISHSSRHTMTHEDGEWKVSFWTSTYNDEQPTVTVKS